MYVCVPACCSIKVTAQVYFMLHAHHPHGSFLSLCKNGDSQVLPLTLELNDVYINTLTHTHTSTYGCHLVIIRTGQWLGESLEYIAYLSTKHMLNGTSYFYR